MIKLLIERLTTKTDQMGKGIERAQVLLSVTDVSEI